VSSKENVGNPVVIQAQTNERIIIPNENNNQSGVPVTIQNQPKAPPPAPPKRIAAVSELPRTNVKISAGSTHMARISSRGYTKPLPKLMPTIRAGVVADANGNGSSLPPPPSNSNTLRNSKAVVVSQPKLPAVPPRNVPKQPASGVNVSQSPKRAVSVGPKTITIQQPRTLPSLASGHRPTSILVRKTSRESTVVAPSPKKGTATTSELITRDQTLQASRESTSPRNQGGAVPKGTSTEISRPSNTNQPGISRTPSSQNINGEGTRKASSEHRRVSSYHTANTGVVRRPSKDLTTNVSHLRAPSGVGPTQLLSRNTSKDYSQNQSEGAATNQVTPGHAKRASRESNFQPGHRRVPSSQSVSVPPGQTRKPSRDTIAVAPAGTKRPPSFSKTAPSTPTKQEPNNNTITQSNGASVSPPSRGAKGSAVPKLALGNVKSAQPEITSDPNRALAPVAPKPPAPQTARERLRTQFLDDKPAVIEPKSKPMVSTFIGTNANISSPSKKPASPGRSATVSTQGGVKTRIGASPKSK
jgi:hypothetical protein